MQESGARVREFEQGKRGASQCWFCEWAGKGCTWTLLARPPKGSVLDSSGEYITSCRLFKRIKVRKRSLIDMTYKLRDMELTARQAMSLLFSVSREMISSWRCEKPQVYEAAYETLNDKWEIYSAKKEGGINMNLYYDKKQISELEKHGFKPITDYFGRMKYYECEIKLKTAAGGEYIASRLKIYPHNGTIKHFAYHPDGKALDIFYVDERWWKEWEGTPEYRKLRGLCTKGLAYWN